MNPELVLPLETMTVGEKMDVIDRVMNDLARNSSTIPNIEWHGEMLRQREESLNNGEDHFITLAEAESRIRQKTGRQ